MSQVKTKMTDQCNMGSFLLAFLAVTLFCLCAHQFIKNMIMPIPVMNHTRYKKAALRLEKSYKVFSWGVMTFLFLMGLVVSFYQVYTSL